MSASENKRLMQAIYAKVAEGDGALFVEHLADDVVMRVTGRNSWSHTFTGKQHVLKNLFGYLATILEAPRKTIAMNFIADGDFVAVEARGEMVTKNGTPYNNEYCLVYRLENKKIVGIREYLDSDLCEKVLGPYPSTAKN